MTVEELKAQAMEAAWHKSVSPVLTKPEKRMVVLASVGSGTGRPLDLDPEPD